MIIGEGGTKKLYISMIAVTLLLFLFSCVLLKENSLYSLACAIVPFSIYSLMDKIYVLRKMKKYKSKGKKLYILAGINLFIILAMVSYCTYIFSKGDVICTIMGTGLYGLIDLALWCAIKYNG